MNWATYECSSCHRITLAESYPALMNHDYEVYGPGSDKIRLLYPTPATVDDSLPEDAQRYLRQAIETKFAPDACIVMAASAVDAMLREKGYKKGSLYARIKSAVDDHTLTEAMAKWAHKVRLDANAVRHVDDNTQPPSEEEAQQAIEFAKALGDFLYVFTARVEEGIKDASLSDDETEMS
ncbi:DUF4145 domain-containing protein [Nitratireductor sp. L15S-10]|uniref:DUF4145 domain-containing protein n=1 Tax=Nitratireductor sp. L15S-10 TaxID=3034028 RepID=UPI0038574AAF